MELNIGKLHVKYTFYITYVFVFIIYHLYVTLKMCREVVWRLATLALSPVDIPRLAYRGCKKSRESRQSFLRRKKVKLFSSKKGLLGTFKIYPVSFPLFLSLDRVISPLSRARLILLHFQLREHNNPDFLGTNRDGKRRYTLFVSRDERSAHNERNIRQAVKKKKRINPKRRKSQQELWTQMGGVA